ncbi:MAG: hypothetical protein AB1486_13675 [Planctomycetota bacterium]
MLRKHTVFEVELIEPQGTTFAKCGLVGVSPDGTRRSGQTRVTGEDNVFTCQLDVSSETIQAIELEVAGYETVRDEVRGVLTTGERRRYALLALPRVHLEIHAPFAATQLKGLTVGLLVVACLIPPNERLHQQRCCGLGGDLSIPLHFPYEGDELTVEAEIPVRTQRPYWIYLTVHGQRRVVGPYAPSGQSYEIRLPVEMMQHLGQQFARVRESHKKRDGKKPAQKPPPLKQGFISVEAIDAETLQPIGGARLHLDRPRGAYSTNVKGRVVRAPLTEGSWSATLSHLAYESSPPINFTLGADQHVDLGRIALQPHPKLLVRLLAPDGTPWPADKRVDLTAFVATGLGRYGGLSITSSQDATDGTFTIQGSLPQQLVLQVSTAHQRRQLVAIDGWEPRVPKAIRLRAWQAVEVHITNMPPDLSGARLNVELLSESGLRLRGHELTAPREGTRRFQFEITAGRYETLVSSPLFRAAPQRVEVEERDSVQVFEIAVY